MRRRTAIRNLVILSAGAAVLPACQESAKTASGYANLDINQAALENLESLSETLIPTSANFSGGRTLRSHEFVLTMVNDCAKPEDRAAFMKGLRAFEELCITKWNTSFAKAEQAKRYELLKELEGMKDGKGELTGFYKTVKRLTIQSFTSSREFLIDVRKFTLVPGSNFKGCVRIGAALNT